MIVLDPIIPIGDPALCWALDPRNDAVDLSGNGRDGTAGGSITLGGLTDAPPGWNGSTEFDGTDDRITTTYAAFTGPRTFMGWAKRNTSTTEDTLFSGDGTGVPILRLDSGSQQVRFHVNDTLVSPTFWAAAWPGNGVWVHWTLPFDPGNDVVSLYINGLLVSTQAETDNYSATPGNFRVGGYGAAGTTGVWGGPMARLQVFERIVTAGEIATEYERGKRAAFKRLELDLDAAPIQARTDGIDWGDAAIEQELAEQRIGATPVDYRLPPRQVTIPLRVDGDEGKRDLQDKVGRLRTEGGTLKRVTSAGSLFADVFNATLTMPDSWFGRHRGIEPEARLVLECSPDFYGLEEDKGRTTGTAKVTPSLTNVKGNAPGAMRAIIENLSTVRQKGLFFAVRSRQRGDGTDAMVHEAESLTPLGGAAVAAQSGASGGDVVQHTNLPGASWLAILETKKASGGQQMTHIGPHRVLARVRDPAAAIVTPGVEVKLRLEWFAGDASRPELGDVVAAKPGGKFGIVDLGMINPRRARSGAHTWIGRVLAKADSAGADIQIDELYVFPASEGSGKIIASSVLPTPTAFSARDEFDQSVGNLAGKALPDGSGSWAGAGDPTDFTVGLGAISRSEVSDADGITGRYAIAPPVLTDTVVEIDFQQDTILTANNPWGGAIARYTDVNNWLFLLLIRTANPGSPGTFLYYEKNKAGVLSVPAATRVRPTTEVDTYDSLRFMALASGEYAAWVSRGGVIIGDPLFHDWDADLASGTLASGKGGIYDLNTSVSAVTRVYDNFRLWVPSTDAVLFPSQVGELRTDGYERRSADGSGVGSMVVDGPLPRLPQSGDDARTVEMLVRASRGNLNSLGDDGLDSIAVRILHRPSWISVPGA